MDRRYNCHARERVLLRGAAAVLRSIQLSATETAIALLGVESAPALSGLVREAHHLDEKHDDDHHCHSGDREKRLSHAAFDAAREGAQSDDDENKRRSDAYE